MATPPATFQTSPPPTPTYILAYPAPYVLLITINRPHAMNSLPYASHWEADALLSWFDGEPSLRVTVVTGAGPKAFCAGQDLIEQGVIAAAAAVKEGWKGAEKQEGGKEGLPPRQMLTHPPSGFMGISRRTGKKPVIAAVNGWAMGGGFEICLNCDLLIASPTATFALPEASRGLYAAAGGLSRLVRLIGLPLASEIALASRRLTATDALRLNLINAISKTPGSVVDEAVAMARRIGEVSPDAVVVSRHGLRMAWEEGSVEVAARRTEETYGRGLREGENLRRGLQAFKEKRKPEWVASRL